MNRLLFSSVLVTVAVLASAGRAGAQSPFYPNGGSYPGYFNYSRFSSPLSAPALNPYLNLRRSGATPALNYFLGTLPELDRRANALRFSARLGDLERKTAALEEEELVSELPQTGHGAAFMNYGSYYNFGTGFQPGLGGGYGGYGTTPGARRPR
jgi:hypothetical protein